MCGIAGIVSTAPGDFGSSMKKMLQAMVHRGPDDEGEIVLGPPQCSGSVVLGSCRLAILDLTGRGHMPMQNSGTGDWMVYN
ncbi:MAG: hypothetical protein HY594_04335, partial [Candidatus Omnitrophica bacterium]|nr:hypothetical protein [Candidatus Omnitrophota bacterium]